MKINNIRMPVSVFPKTNAKSSFCDSKTAIFLVLAALSVLAYAVFIFFKKNSSSHFCIKPDELEQSIKDGNLIAINAALDKDPDLFTRPLIRSGDTLLHIAVREQQIEIIEAIGKKSPKAMNAINSGGFTPLRLCLYNADYIKSFKPLLEINETSIDTLVAPAIATGKSEYMKILFSLISIETAHLHLAAINLKNSRQLPETRKNIFWFLLERNPENLVQKDEHGKTVLDEVEKSKILSKEEVLAKYYWLISAPAFETFILGLYSPQPLHLDTPSRKFVKDSLFDFNVLKIVRENLYPFSPNHVAAK